MAWVRFPFKNYHGKVFMIGDTHLLDIHWVVKYICRSLDCYDFQTVFS